MDIQILGDTGGPDVGFADGDLVLDRGLETAVFVSLFSDARARPEDKRTDVRGWWGDQPGAASFGSRLYLLERASITPETLELARTYALESLAWMKQDGIAREIEVQAERLDQDGISLAVSVFRGDAQRWAHLWSGQQQNLEARQGTTRVVLVLNP